VDDGPRIAVVDPVLNDKPDLAITRELAKAGVPFVVLTAWSRPPHPSPEYDGAPWLALPCRADVVVDAVEALLHDASASP
jgi:hypothetical protein